MPKQSIPSFDSFLNPVIQALRALWGSGNIEEINSKVIEITDLSDQQLDVLHTPGKGTQTEVEYRLAWARTYLKKYGLLENSQRGIWALTPEGHQTDRVSPKKVIQYVREQRKQDIDVSDEELSEEGLDEALSREKWHDELLQTLLQMKPDAFERLVQRILRESGFIQVEVTGKTGDGGIDGKGIMRLGGLLSFHVIFQCKRYSGSVSVSQVRDFRGAMVGRADKGLLITTGNYTKDAIKEATRDGAPAIDLIDGDQLVEKLKELSLGVKTEIVEKVTIQKDWLFNI